MKIFDFFCSKKGLLVFIVIVYFFFAMVQWSFDKNLKVSGVYFGLPHIYSGDELEYLVTLNSLLSDDDFKLCNNYNEALRGGCQAGTMYRSMKAVVARACLSGSERLPSRSVFAPLSAATLFWQFAAQPCLIEPMAVFFVLLVSLLVIFFSWRILELFNLSKKIIMICILTLVFASPFWFYSKTFWSEPFLALFLVLSLYFFLENRFSFSGFFLAINLLVKPTALIFALFFFAFCFFGKNKKKIPLLLAGFLFGSLFFFLVNLSVFGNPFFVSKSQDAFGVESFSGFANGFFAEFFSPNFGFLFSFPLFIFALIGFWFFFQKNRPGALLLFFVLFGYIVFWAQVPWITEGTGGYSFRYLAPLLPVIIVPIGFFLQENKSKALSWLFWIFFAISFLINIQAALTPFLINNPPWFILEKIVQLFF